MWKNKTFYCANIGFFEEYTISIMLNSQISRRIEAEDQARRAAGAVRQFFASWFHDIRAPLTGWC